MPSKHLDFMILQRKKEGMKRAKAAFVAAEKNGTLKIVKVILPPQ
ncbi:hypothetical protein [Yersinia mollaretii]|uniref:Uncharacterized protein n=1 Tax=Yersinia mollaretii TaxID=33060 RepID=A0AA36LL52_YERMO|nr:hypothetical protein [Yersinia mollaretii]MDA5526036.1 hypothetical protein [Yersinia mollaretii]MDR7872137.1 hypothetical protein [Yersinia mollaretii]WQC73337.1 hypothetical protein U1Z61_12755 [Yersinia mollaretii]CNE22196.1 Uncharacterised protein [Yersinia mollaretii]CNH36042.1 Uncharacterised protein [Yersinia mollaretii]